MKISVQKDNQSETYQIEIPSSVDLTYLSPGESFPISIFDNKNKSQNIKACLLADGKSFLVGNNVVRVYPSLIHKKNNIYRITINNNGIVTQNHAMVTVIKSVKPRNTFLNLGGGELRSPMTGKIISIAAKNNGKVKEGDTLLVIEAMKMENRIIAECSGIISGVKVRSGTSVLAGDLLLNIIPET